MRNKLARIIHKLKYLTLQQELTILLLLLLLVLIPPALFLSRQGFDLRKFASEEREGSADMNLQEQKIEKTQAQGVNIATLTKTLDVASSSPILVKGQWHGKIVKVVPNDRFFLQYNYFTYYGIRSITATKDGRIFLGGLRAFAIRPNEDENWQNLQLVEIPTSYDPSGSNVILKITEVNGNSGDIYLKGLNISLKLNSNAELSKITDPSTGEDLELKDIVPYGENGLVGWADGPVGFSDGALYYMEGDVVRKWLAPRPDPTTNSDSIQAMFADKTDGDFKKFYAIVHHCYAAPCYSSSAWGYYLYQFNFSNDLSVPLESIKLGKIAGANSELLFDGQVQKRIDDPNKKIFYSRRSYFSQFLTTIADFNPSLSELNITATEIPGPYGCCSQTKNITTEDRPEGDVVWMSGGGSGSYSGVYYVTGLDTTGTPSISEMTPDERRTLLASENSESITTDLTDNIYVGHDYFSDGKGLVTIFETPIPTLTPTQTPTSTPTPTPTPRNNPPTITTTALPEGKVDRDYEAEIRGGDADFADSLTMNIRFLPRGLSKKECKNVKRRGINSISCKIEGRPKVATGTNYNITVLISDGKATTSKKLKLRIKP